MFTVFGRNHGNLEIRGYLLGEPLYYKDLFRVECFGGGETSLCDHEGMVQSTVGLRTEISMVPGKRKGDFERHEETTESKGQEGAVVILRNERK